MEINRIYWDMMTYNRIYIYIYNSINWDRMGYRTNTQEGCKWPTSTYTHKYELASGKHTKNYGKSFPLTDGRNGGSSFTTKAKGGQPHPPTPLGGQVSPRETWGLSRRC